jgi:hypothetical protein
VHSCWRSSLGWGFLISGKRLITNSTLFFLSFPHSVVTLSLCQICYLWS